VQLLKTTLAIAAAIFTTSAASAGPVITNGNFSQATETGQTSCGLAPTTVCSEELGGTSPYPTSATDVTGWTSAGYNFLLTPGVATGAGAPTPEYGNSFSLWGMANGGANSWNGAGPGPGNGGNFIALDGDYNTGAMSTLVTGLTAGSIYAISFSFAFGQQAGFTGATVQNMIVTLGSQSINALASNYDLPSEGFSGWMYDTLYFTADASSETLSFLAYGNVPVPPFALLAGVEIPEPNSLVLSGVGLAGVIGLALRRRAAARGAA